MTFDNSTKVDSGSVIDMEMQDEVHEIVQQTKNLLNNGLIKNVDAETIIDVLSREHLVKALLKNNEAKHVFADVLNNKDGSYEALRLFCMGIWLESSNTFAIDDSGNLDVTIKDGEVLLAGEVAKSDSMLYRQAVIRQIERWAVLRENGLLDLNEENCKSVLDVGSGTLIASVMLRDLLPSASITAVEPGLVTDKTKNIAGNKDINLHHGNLVDVETDKKFDAILLHFVLEHTEEQARQLVREALVRLSPDGVLSIAVPNYNALHRELETHIGMNKRDPTTRLSLHDHLSGHQIIFDEATLTKLLQDVIREVKADVAISSSTILPRPFAFNTLCAMKEQIKLLDMQLAGHVPGMEDKGSVLCFKVGKNVAQMKSHVDSSGTTKELFKKLVKEYLDLKGREGDSADTEKLVAFLEKNYPELV